MINISIQIKLSSTHQAVTLENLSKEHANEIINLLTGVQGINRITVEWEADQEAQDQDLPETVNESTQYTPNTKENTIEPPAQNRKDDITYPEQPCEIVAHPKSPIAQGVPQEEEDPETLFLLFERPRVYKNDLGPYINIETLGMGYHDQPDPDKRIVLCRGTTKVYTTIGDMERLKFPINPDELVNLNPAKQAAVKQFKQWVETDYKDHFKMTPEDQDADYKNQLPPGMIDTGTTSIDSSKHEGPMPE